MLQELSQLADVYVNFSVGSLDEKVWKLTEPGTPNPLARLEAMQFLVENGVAAGVMMAPLIPGLSDDRDGIDAVVAAAARHGAHYLGANVLFLKPGSKEWFMPMLREAYPHLTRGYAQLYRKTYAPREYTDAVLAVVEESRRKWGLPKKRPERQLQARQQQLQFSLTA